MKRVNLCLVAAASSTSSFFFFFFFFAFGHFVVPATFVEENITLLNEDVFSLSG